MVDGEKYNLKLDEKYNHIEEVFKVLADTIIEAQKG